MDIDWKYCDKEMYCHSEKCVNYSAIFHSASAVGEVRVK